MASVVLSVVVVGVSGTLITASSETATLQDDHQAMSLATQLIEQISQLPMTDAAAPDVGGWSTNNKIASTYDNIPDYAGYTDYFAVQPGQVGTDGKPLVALTAVDSTYIAANHIAFPSTTVGGIKAFKRTVTFQYRATPSGASAASGPFGLVTVTVTANVGGSAVTLARLFADVTMK